jgi:Domain of unknown function (DUF4349)/Putative zinc-finger
MNTLEHTMAPEDVMAFVDGELSAADARVVGEHLEHCTECALLAEQLRGTSEMLERWEVPAVPRAVEEVVASKALEARGWRVFSRRFPTWKVVGFAVPAVIAAMLMVSVLTTSRTGPPSYETSPPNYQMMAPLASQVPLPPTAREYAKAKDKFHALEERKPQGGMSESLVANGPPPPGPPPPISMMIAPPGVAGMNGAMAQKDARNLRAPMIARTASLTIVVKNVESARTAMDAIVARHQGYPATLNVSAPETGGRSVVGSLKIPAEEMSAAIGELRALGRVVNEAQSGEDVGQQHEDLVARLKTARETEERFQAILEQRTGKISDVLEVEENIARVRGDIEGMEAAQRAMEHRVDFASVDVQLTEVYKAKLETPDSVGTRLHNAFVAGYRNAAETVLGLVLFLEEYGPALLIWAVILGAPIVWTWGRYKKARGRVGF